jgi:hypothetical protein
MKYRLISRSSTRNSLLDMVYNPSGQIQSR